MSRVNIPKYLIVHHTGDTKNNPNFDSSDMTLEQINNSHRLEYNFISRIGHYCGYHYVIFKNGTVKQCRLETEEGAQCFGMNISSIGICLTGNFNRPSWLKNNRPTKEQEDALEKLLEALMKKYSIPLSKVVPHRYFGITDCYGKNLPNDWAQKLVERDNNIDIELLKKKISILQKLIQLYIKLLNFLKKGRFK